MSTETVELQEFQGVRVAVEGCGHGQLHAIYASIEESCKARSWDGVDLVIIGGDFQAARNPSDLNVMSVPAKYLEMGDFHQYYSGARIAPYLTIFIGGNHEASSHLMELYYGGWAAPNIYYFGAANVLRLGPLRIAGFSGIWKGFDYKKPHHERLPMSADDIKSAYHVREIDVRKLLLLRTQVDVGLSHDWPRGVEWSGDHRYLFRMKRDFERESRDGTLGSVAAEYVMDRLRPPYWFSAHMHCKFSALKKYDPPIGEKGVEAEGGVLLSATNGAGNVLQSGPVKDDNPDEIDLDLDLDVPDESTNATDKPPSSTEPPTTSTTTTTPPSAISETLRAQLPASFARPVRTQPPQRPGQPVPPTIPNTEVRFLALDKCLPGRHFLQLCEIAPFDATNLNLHPPAPTTPRFRLEYDPEWLAITRVLAPSVIVGDKSALTPPDLGPEHYYPLIDAERAWVEENIVKRDLLSVPEDFVLTAPVHAEGEPERVSDQPVEYTNPHTDAFCRLVGVPVPWDATEEERSAMRAVGPPPSTNVRFGGRGGGYGGGGRGGGRGNGRGWGRGRGRGGRGRY